MTRHIQASSRRAKRWRSTIPKDIYDSVLGFAVDIVNATLRDDASSARAHYRRLKRYCAAQEAKGRVHPFLPETLADFAYSKHTAIKLYHRALRLSRREGEQQHTILLSLGQLHLAAGNRRAARRRLNEARADALRHHAPEYVAEAVRLLSEEARQPNPGMQRTRFARR
jgi:hypothetical protein